MAVVPVVLDQFHTGHLHSTEILIPAVLDQTSEPCRIRKK
jgi:hypothetical protein